jgi:16S rRNA (uracil1498-N3)-methyltransferase
MSSDDAHHLVRVLRLRSGESVTISDGRGGWRPCRFVGGEALEPDGDVRTEPAPAPSIAVGFGIPKGDRPEWIVQKLTEIGVDRIIPLNTDRGVVRWDADRGARHLVRLRRVAREAASQSRRTWLPVIEDVAEAIDLLKTHGVAAATMGGGPLSLSTPTVLVGPEGGWTERELAGSIISAGLGATVMRVDTATLVAGTILAQHRDHAASSQPVSLQLRALLTEQEIAEP